ncbi:MAG: prolyl oligopeptidase family serine peptidase, partial [Flavitalea sp.]
MIKLILSFTLVVIVLGKAGAQLVYPPAIKSDQQDNYHGTIVADPYRWLEDENSEATKNWITAENKICRDYLSAIPFREQVKKRIRALYNYPRYGAPFLKKGYIYFYKNEGLQEHAVLYRQKGERGALEKVLDPNTFSDDKSAALSSFALSGNNRYGAYGISRAGSDWETYYIKDLTNMKDIPDAVKWVKASEIAWQGNGFYYSRYPKPADRQELSYKNENHQVWFHIAGTSQEQDKLVFEDSLHPLRFHLVYVSEDERYAFLYVADPGSGIPGNALFYQDSQSKHKGFLPLIADVGKYTYDLICEDKGKFIVQTTNGAPNGKLVMINPQHPAPAQWKTIIAEKKEPIQRCETGGGKLFVSYLKDVSSKVYVHYMSGALQSEVRLPGLGAAKGFSGERGDRYIFYEFNSFTSPSVIYRYDVANGKNTVFRKPRLLFNPIDYITKQVFYTSNDGTKIPMFIVHRKGLLMDGKAPALLYGYGGFNISMEPSFSPPLIAWLEQGGIYAVANIRGGAEYGEKWHEAGMLLNKQQVFDDFIAAAEYLVKNKITSTQRLAINGASNGGLLIAVVVNQRPDLFKVAIPEVGVMDMLRFHKFTLGYNWISEYGSSDSAKYFKNLYAYSPLHNISKNINYPAMLIATADHDDRVVPAHSFKYTATLQELYKGPNPILISIDNNTGHGSGNISKTIDLTADIYSFIFFNMELHWKEKG